MRIKSSRRRRRNGLSLPFVLLLVWLAFFGTGWVAWQLSLSSALGRHPRAPFIQQEHFPSPRPPSRPVIVLLTTPERGTTASTDVRGNLGPASVVLQNRTTDWLKDRWQAAMDMHGTAIQGAHWVQVHMGRTVRVQRFLLDWETAFAEDYRLEGWYQNQSVVLYFDAQQEPEMVNRQRSSHSYGRSPGVKQKLPLHIIHEISCSSTSSNIPVDELRLRIRKSAHPSWGVSLWRFQAFGYETTV